MSAKKDFFLPLIHMLFDFLRTVYKLVLVKFLKAETLSNKQEDS